MELLPEQVEGAIAFSSVWVNYAAQREALPSAAERQPDGVGDGADPQWALNGLSLDISPGQLAAFVGPSGAGKTTISYLIPRLYDATHGSISIDGVDVRNIQLTSLAGLIGYVTQESYLFHASIRDKSDVRQRCGPASPNWKRRPAPPTFTTVSLSSPEGYDTVVGEAGLPPVRRRAAKAGHRPGHPASTPDPDSRRGHFGPGHRQRTLRAVSLEPLMRGRTTVAIAHRLSTIIAADVIYVIDHGRVVEQGSHLELLARGGLYARLYDDQFEGGRIECYCEDGVVLSDGNIRHPEPEGIFA